MTFYLSNGLSNDFFLCQIIFSYVVDAKGPTLSSLFLLEF